MGAKHQKPHNAFTNHEVEFLRTNWPTRMPLAEILAVLSRHTKNSVQTYANKILHLRRPCVKTHKPAWDRVSAMLKVRPMSQVEISAEMGFSRSRASELLREHPGEVYIVSWRWPEDMGRAEAVWALGNQPNAPEPAGEQRAPKLSAPRRTNPFLVAAGAITAPPAATGRIYRQSMSIREDELEAA